jgi:hypothetical protein
MYRCLPQVALISSLLVIKNEEGGGQLCPASII